MKNDPYDSIQAISQSKVKKLADVHNLMGLRDLSSVSGKSADTLPVGQELVQNTLSVCGYGKCGCLSNVSGVSSGQ